MNIQNYWLEQQWGNDMGKILEIKNLNKSFENGFKLQNINFDIEEGEIVSLIGESGSGKTTISKMLVGLMKGEGEILFKGQNICRIFWLRLDLKKRLQRNIQMNCQGGRGKEWELQEQ